MISVIIIGYNSYCYIEKCVNSLISQTFRDLEIIFIDNNSNDESINLISNKYPNIRLVQNNKNFGYAKAANQGIDLSNGTFVLIINPDMILEKDYIKHASDALLQEPKAAGVIGKIYKFDFKKSIKTNIIDTTGIVALKGRKFIDKGAAKIDYGQYDFIGEVFGIPGNCALYRRTALYDSRIGTEYFDEDFFMYKEDVDLSWRLKLYGWKFIYTYKAVGYHERGTGVINRNGLIPAMKARRKLNNFQRFYSLKNHRLMIIKNEKNLSFTRQLLNLIIREAAIFIWAILFERIAIKAYLGILQELNKMIKKRRFIMNKTKPENKGI
jgi:GT2 family glycosyltransferase